MFDGPPAESEAPAVGRESVTTYVLVSRWTSSRSNTEMATFTIEDSESFDDRFIFDRGHTHGQRFLQRVQEVFVAQCPRRGGYWPHKVHLLKFGGAVRIVRRGLEGYQILPVHMTVVCGFDVLGHPIPPRHDKPAATGA